jgi:hypothetical protein
MLFAGARTSGATSIEGESTVRSSIGIEAPVSLASPTSPKLAATPVAVEIVGGAQCVGIDHHDRVQFRALRFGRGVARRVCGRSMTSSRNAAST